MDFVEACYGRANTGGGEIRTFHGDIRNAADHLNVTADRLHPTFRGNDTNQGLSHFGLSLIHASRDANRPGRGALRRHPETSA